MDGIGNNILRACAPSITEPLKMIAQKSIDTGVFPKSWKKSNVVPIFKHKGAKDSVANYRPISLLSCMSKVVERQVYNELYNFCMENGLLSEKNSGFKKKVGTIDQLISLTNKIYQGLDDGEEIAMIFLDLSKAYDRVWHTGLLHKLKKIGIRGSLLDWFKSYLTGRTHAESGLCRSCFWISRIVCFGTSGLNISTPTLLNFLKRHRRWHSIKYFSVCWRCGPAWKFQKSWSRRDCV